MDMTPEEREKFRATLQHIHELWKELDHVMSQAVDDLVGLLAEDAHEQRRYIRVGEGDYCMHGLPLNEPCYACGRAKIDRPPWPGSIRKEE